MTNMNNGKPPKRRFVYQDEREYGYDPQDSGQPGVFVAGELKNNDSPAQSERAHNAYAQQTVEQMQHSADSFDDEDDAYEAELRSRSDRKRGGDGEGGRKKSKKGLIITLTILGILLVALTVFGIVVGMEISGNRGSSAMDVVVTLPEGGSTSDVAQVLYDNGIIGNVTAFKAYSRLTGADGTYQFGDHTVSGNMSYSELIAVLQQMTIKPLETFSITFPEGTTTLKMGMMLEEQGICTRDAFVEACRNDVFDVSFYNEITIDELKFIKIEGFLYPDTYEFEVGVTPHDIIQAMLENFEQKVLTPAFRASLEESGMTLEEAVTLASIVQKESFGGEEKNVSSVFHNRMAPGSPVGRLESDTTWYFIYNVIDYYYNGKENAPSAMREAYDSYSVDGLIVGAICNPGMDMIEAAVAPNETPYYFFLTDNNKKFYWAVTANEHEANVQTMNRVNQEIEDAANE